MNILQVTPYFAPAWAYGGPPRSVYELSRELVQQGHSVTVLTTDALDATNRAKPVSETMDGIEVHRCRNLGNNLAWRQQLFLPSGTALFLRAYLRDFDIVHLHMFRTVQNAITHRLATKYSIPYVLSARGSLPRIVRGRAAKSLFDAVAGRRLLRDAKKVIALSSAESSDYESIGVPTSKITVIFNGIDPTLYRNLPRLGTFARMHGLEGRKLVTYIGRINARKGLDHLLRAFRGLSQTGDDVKLVLAGPDDGYRGRLETLAEELSLSKSIIYAGPATMSEKLQILADSDLIVYPAEHEVFGLVPFEALLCGKPVVVANDSGCGEIVEMARAGLTIPYGDSARLQKAIATCLENGAAIREMVIQGQRFVLKHMDWSRIARDIVQVYEDAIFAVSGKESVAS